MASGGLLDGSWGARGVDQQTFWGLMFALFVPFGVMLSTFFRCLLGASPALFVVLVSACFLCRCSSRRCSYFARGENGRDALRTVKTIDVHDFA